MPNICRWRTRPSLSWQHTEASSSRHQHFCLFDQLHPYSNSHSTDHPIANQATELDLPSIAFVVCASSTRQSSTVNVRILCGFFIRNTARSKRDEQSDSVHGKRTECSSSEFRHGQWYADVDAAAHADARLSWRS